MSPTVRAAEQAGLGTLAGQELRGARLLFDPELTRGALDAAALQGPVVRDAVRVRGVPARPVRVAEQLLYRFGRLDFERAVAGPLLTARRALLGAGAGDRPRFLVRVDEFPHYQAWDAPERFGVSAFEPFHEIMAAAGVSYLLAVLPRVSRRPLSPSASGSRPLHEAEVAMLDRLSRERVSFALHGLDHRTRFASPRRRSELCGLGAAQTDELLDQALAELASQDIRPDVFVPPYNRFDARQLALLARRFAVVCGGPESIGAMGFQPTPQWRGETVYLPAYAPFYGRAAKVLPAVERMIERAMGLWVPVVLHWGWEAQTRWRELERLVARIAPYCARWEDFRAAIERSRMPATPAASGIDRSDRPARVPEVEG